MHVQCGVMHSLSASLRGQSPDVLSESGHSHYHFKMVAFTVSYYSDQALENHVELTEKQQNPKQNNKQTKQNRKTPKKKRVKQPRKIKPDIR